MSNIINYFDRASIRLGGFLGGTPTINRATTLAAGVLTAERMTSLHAQDSYGFYAVPAALAGVTLFSMSIISNALINRHLNHQVNRLIPNQTHITQIRHTLTTLPSEEREHFTNLILSLQIREVEHIPFFSTIIASEPYDRRSALTYRLDTFLSNWTRNQLTVAEFVSAVEFRNTYQQINLIHRLHTTISDEMSDEEMQRRLSVFLVDQQSDELHEIHQDLLNNEEPWTEEVAAHVDESHDDARLRQVAHEQSLAQGAPAKDFFHTTILEYLQSSAQDKGQLIEDFESYAPDIYLEIIKHAVIKTIASKEPLINPDGSSHVLPLCLLSIGPELEVLRKNQYQGNIKAIASELQQKTSVKVAMQDAMNSVLESVEYQNWKM